jgi:hypothetical protein
MKDLITLTALHRGKFRMGDWIAGLIFFLVCNLIVVIVGAITRTEALLLLGGIGAVLFGIVLAISIFINIRRNRPKW